ncbi:MAG: helix-turn-helix domain-containing protein [Lachnospiraceae bacterium]|nr:helix-turn-helix domain-containing protein [Lachnospiraceae bacterium]
MDMDIGSTIKKLRMNSKMTQEEVAEYLGISFQAVSKWETGTTMPDIALLPKIAAFFGVKIDDLFSVNHEDELQRVDYILSHDGLSEQSYFYAKRALDASLQDNPDDVRALKLYARLHLTKTNGDLLEAGRMLEKAMECSPLDEDIFDLYRQVRGGGIYKVHSDNDWFIRVCEPYAQKFPQNYRLISKLVEAMISMRYFDKAEEYINRMQLDDSTQYLRQVYLGDLELAKGNPENAIAIWNAISGDDSMGQYQAGERFNRINEYDRAIKCFENSFQAATSPRALDALYSLAFLYTKLKRKAEAIKAWQLILSTLASDYNDYDSENVKWAHNEIRKLQDAATLSDETDHRP